MNAPAAAGLGVGLLVAGLAAQAQTPVRQADVRLPSVQCASARIGPDAVRGSVGSPAWMFVINCTSADGARQSWRATEPIFANGVCSYRYAGAVPAEKRVGQTTGQRLVPRGTIFDRAAIVSGGACPAVTSRAYANLWKVDLATFRAISNLDYRSQFHSQNVRSRDAQIERISFVGTTLGRSQYEVDFVTAAGDRFGAAVYRWPFGIYSISSFGRLVL